MLEHYAQDLPYGGAVKNGLLFEGGDYLSCDAGDMMSPDQLRTFGIPYTQRICRAWHSAFLHHHELGIHQVPTWTECEGLTVQSLNRDPNTQHLAQEMPEEVLACSRRMPVGFIALYDEFMERAQEWAEGRFVVAVRCDDRDQADDVLRLAESCRGYCS